MASRKKPGPAAQLHDYIERLSSLFRSSLRSTATEEGLKLVQLEALIYLSRANRYSDSPAAVGEYLGLTKGTVSQTLKTLQTRGFIDKSNDAQDARIQHCSLTTAGAAVVRRAYPLHELQDTNTHAAVSSLQELLRNLQKNNEGRSFGVCSGCKFHERRGRELWCGLTEEPLSSHDALRICREYEEVVA